MRKRIYIIILTFVFLFAALLPVCARHPSKYAVKLETYAEYSNYVNTKAYENVIGKEIDFIEYRQIAALGRFKNFLYIEGRTFEYTLQDEFGNIGLAICQNNFKHKDVLDAVYRYITQDGEWLLPPDIALATLDDVVDTSNMMYLTSRLNPDNFFPLFFYVQVGDVYFCYLLGAGKEECPSLYRIEWIHDGNLYKLCGFDNDYPAGKNTLAGRFFNSETVDDALAELTADIDRGYTLEYAFHVVGVIFAALIVIGAAIALPIVIVKRKRKKAADGAENEAESIELTPPSDRE